MKTKTHTHLFYLYNYNYYASFINFFSLFLSSLLFFLSTGRAILLLSHLHKHLFCILFILYSSLLYSFAGRLLFSLCHSSFRLIAFIFIDTKQSLSTIRSPSTCSSTRQLSLLSRPFFLHPSPQPLTFAQLSSQAVSQPLRLAFTSRTASVQLSAPVMHTPYC